MSLFSLDNILLENSNNQLSNDIIDIDNIGYLDKNINQYSFISEGYAFILEMNAEYINSEKMFYSNILGSYGDDKIINESFNGFFNKIKDIIDKFIKWIKKIFKTFVTKINALFGSEKFIKKNEKLLQKFDSQDEFEFNGYEFTNVDSNAFPAATALSAFTSDIQGKGYLEDLYDGIDWDSITGENDDERRANASTIMNTKLQNNIDNLNNSLEDFYDEFRALVIGKKAEKIDSNDYADELFKFFRNNESETSNITIDSTYVNEAYRRFKDYKTVINNIEKVQKDIIKDYESLSNYLDKMIKLNKDTTDKFSVNNYSGGRKYVQDQIDDLGKLQNNNGELYDKTNYSFDKMNIYLKIQSSKVNQMCNIHTQAFSAKLEAAKNCFTQDKKILYKAIQQVVKRSNKKDS